MLAAAPCPIVDAHHTRRGYLLQRRRPDQAQQRIAADRHGQAGGEPGAGALGWLLGADVSDDAVLILGTAGCGSLTTFSTFALEAVEARDATRVVIVLATVGGSVGAAVLGHLMA